MPPPPSYLDITATPYSQLVSQADFNAGTYGGVARQTWFRRITTVSSCFGVHSDRGGTFNPLIVIYQSDGTTVVKSGTASASFYAQLPTPGTYYVKVSQAGASNFDFTFIADERPLNGFVPPAGAILINDDSNGPPASVYQMDGTLIGFLSDPPAGEICAGLFDGTTIWQDRFNQHGGGAGSFAVLDSACAYLTSALPFAWGGLHSPTAASETDFYAVDKSTGDIYIISAAGAITGPVATLPTGTPNLIFAFGVSRDGSIAYWAQKGDVNLHRHDLNTDTPLSDIYTAPEAIGVTANNLPGEILCLPDGTLVTWYGDLGNPSNLVHLSALGTVLHGPYTFTGTYLYADHLSYANGSESVNLWRLADPFLDSGRFSTFDLATGTESPAFETTLFQQQVSLISDDPTVLAASESCSMVTFLPTAGPPPCPGLASHPRIDGLPYVPPEL